MKQVPSRLILAIVVLLLGVVIWLLPSPPTPRLETAPPPKLGPPKAKDVEEGPHPALASTPEEIQKIKKELEEKLKAYAERAPAVGAALEKIEAEHPEMRAFEDYAMAAMRACNQDEEHFLKLRDFYQQHPEALSGRSQSAKDVTYLTVFLECLDSPDKVAETTAGALVNDLVAGSNFFDVAREMAARAARDQFKDEALATRLSSLQDPAAFLNELKGVRPKIDAAAQAVFAAQVPDPALREYAARVSHAQTLVMLARTYRQSWTGGFHRAAQQNDRDFQEIWSLLNRLPPLSEERIQIFSQLTEINHWHSQAPKTSPDPAHPSANP